jgi:hypothetical protein
MNRSMLKPTFASEWARANVRGSVRDAVRRLVPESAARSRISVRDSLVAALLTMDCGEREGCTDRLLESCDLHHDSLDEQSDEYLGLLHDVLCAR